MNKENQVVSSILVHAEAKDFATVEKKIASVPQMEIIETAENKLAVVLETESTEYAVGLWEDIRRLDGVTGVEIISHFFEDEIKKYKNITN